MANKISVVIDVAVDKANSALDSFRRSVSEAEGATGKFRAGAASASSSLKSNIIPIAGAAGLAIAGFAAKSISAASNLDESTNAVRKSFGTAADAVLKLGDNAAKSFGLSEAAFNDAAVSFASFTQTIAGPGGDVAKTLEDLTTRAADFGSVMNLSVNEAATVFRSGLSGETEPLKRFGIDLSAAAVEAFALSSGLVKSKSEMTEAIKVQARYGLLMKETNKFAGDFADTSDGLANSQRILTAQIEDLQAKIGQRLVPVLADATTSAVAMFDALEDLGLIDLAMKFQDVTSAGSNYNRFMGLARQETDLFGREVNKVTQAQYDAIVAAKEDGASKQELAELVKGFKDEQEAATTATNEWTEATDDAAGAADGYTQFAKGMIRESERFAKAQEYATKAMNAWHDATLESFDASLAYRNQQATTAETIRESALVTDDLKTSTDEAAQAARNAEGAALDQAAAAVALAEQQNAVNGVTLTAEQKTKIYKEELEKIAGFLTGPAREAIDAYIAQLGRIPGSINTNINLNQRGDIIGGSINGRRASGGPVAAGGAYLVGERGPEILQMGGTGGNVVPNNKIGGGNTYNIIFQGLVTDPIQTGRQVKKAIDAFERSGGR